MPLELNGPSTQIAVTASVEKTEDELTAGVEFERASRRWSIAAGVAWAKRTGASVSAKVKWTIAK